MSNAPDTGSTPEPTEWDQSTDRMAAVQGLPRRSPASATMQGVVIKAFGHRFALPMATVAAAFLGAGGIAYNAAEAKVDEYETRIATLEKRAVALENAHQLNAQTLAQIQTSLARIDARVAEVQVTLMRRR